MATEAERARQRPGAAIEGAALVATARVLRQAAGYDRGADPSRAEMITAQAGLLEACARHWGELPADVAARASRVAAAVDQATGHRLMGT